MKLKYLFALILSLSLIPAALAAWNPLNAPSGFGNFGSTGYSYYPGNGVVSIFGTVGQQIYSILSNYYSVFATVFILFFILLYSIFAAGLTKVKVFGDGKTINRQGKMIAVALGLLGDMGIFYYTYSQYDQVQRVLGVMGWMGSLAFAGLVYGITYYNLKTNDAGKMHSGPAWAAAGLALMMYGMFTNSPGAISWGTLILLIAAIVAGTRAGFGGKRDDAPSTRAERREEAREQAEQERRRRAGIPVPQQVQNFQGVMSGPPTNAVNLTWGANPGGDNVVGYQLQRRLAGRTAGPWYRRALTATYRDMVTGWNNVNNNIAGTNFVDGPINTAVDYEYRIRARNNQDSNGPWSNIVRVNSILAPPTNPTTVSGRLVFHDGNQPHPIDNVNVTLQGLPGADATNANGVFTIANIAALAPFNVLINDPSGTYQPRTIPNVPIGATVNFGDIQLTPTGANANLDIVIINTTTGWPAAPPLVVYVLGGPALYGGLINPPVAVPAQFVGYAPASGTYRFNVPAGSYYRIDAFDPATGATALVAPNAGVLLRVPNGAFPNPLNITIPAGACNFNGSVVSSVAPNPPVPNANVQVDGVNNNANAAGIYVLANVPAGPQPVHAVDIWGRYQDFNGATNAAAGVPNMLNLSLNPRVVPPPQINAVVTPPYGATYNMIFP